MSAQQLVRHLGQWRGSGSRYQELSDSIALLVRDGQIPFGSVLPAERHLAAALQLSRSTIAASYQLLRDREIATSRRGSGTIISGSRQSTFVEGSTATGLINIAEACPTAWPGIEELHHQALEAYPETFQQDGYGLAGVPRLRETIAARYTQRGLPTAPDQIMVTSGAQHAIFLLSQTLIRRGDRALVESPTYPHARRAIVRQGGLVAELPVMVAGYHHSTIMSIARQANPQVAYLIPDHHNPTGMSMPQRLKSELIGALCAQGTTIIVDETTAEVTLEGGTIAPPVAVFAPHQHQQDNIIAIGSLAKTVWSGLRVGWIRASSPLIEHIKQSRKIVDLGTGTFAQVVAERALECYDRIIADRQMTMTSQYRHLRDILAEKLPGWTASVPQGGMCLWVDLGAPMSSRLCRQAAKHGVRLIPGPHFGSPGTLERYLRVPFTTPPSITQTAIQLISTAWQECLEEPATLHP